MVEKKRRQGQNGGTPKTVCPKCEQDYLKMAWMLENRKYIRVGLCCPNPACDYIRKDSVELEDIEDMENSTDKTDKIKRLTAEFVKQHERLNQLAEQINELEKE